MLSFGNEQHHNQIEQVVAICDQMVGMFKLTEQIETRCVFEHFHNSNVTSRKFWRNMAGIDLANK